MKFEHIPAEQLHSAWASIREGVEKVRTKGKEGWFPEDVYSELREKRAFLVLGIEERLVGFFIWHKQIEPFTNEPLLNVWCLHGEEALGFRDETIAELDRIAKALGIKRIRLGGRKGWAKVLKEQFEPIRVVYERVLT